MQLKSKSLIPEVAAILLEADTEQPHTGDYEKWDKPGTYLCRLCGHALYRSQSKFIAACGWPSFDEEIDGRVERRPDPDGRRTEIVCERCKGHLGHVFHGENYTAKDTRHCVNSASIDFVPDLTVDDTEEIIVAAGCFWGVEHLFKKKDGVLYTQVGYIGGHKNYPTYEEVCAKTTGHIEAIRVIYDPSKLSLEDMYKYFFEIHDPSQTGGQGPDIGEQYLSRVFYYNDDQKTTAEEVIEMLKEKDIDVATALKPVSTFWPAEEYHQEYYIKTGKAPYCHIYTKRF